MDRAWVDDLADQLPRHGRLIRALRDAIAADGRWRWFEASCSLGAGRGDELSDVDAAAGYAEPLTIDEVEQLGAQLVTGVGEVVDMLVHQMDGWQPETRRFAVEYADAVQLDLVLMPTRWVTGLRHGEVAILDKDGNLADTVTSHEYGPPDERGVREWVLMAWWWISDIAKYLRRGSLFEAAERIALVRQHALKLDAVARGVPYPLFGLTSLLDEEPFELPDGLVDTYPVPADHASVATAASAVVALLADCSDRAAHKAGYNLSTPWERTSRERLAVALTG